MKQYILLIFFVLLIFSCTSNEKILEDFFQIENVNQMEDFVKSHKIEKINDDMMMDIVHDGNLAPRRFKWAT